MTTATATEKISHPYHLELTEDDRFSLLVALGSFAGLCQGNPPPAWLSLTKRLANLAPRMPITVTASVSQQALPGRAAAEAILSPPAQPTLTDHWIKKMPPVHEIIEVPIVKIEDKNGTNGPFLKVTWTNQGRGFGYASVFDAELFPFIKSRLNQRTTLYVVKSGKYINVAGVRA